MEPRANHIIIGFFTLFTVLAILAFTLWLGKSGDSENAVYDIVVRENVSGLTPAARCCTPASRSARWRP